jgi:hypothetical protein
MNYPLRTALWLLYALVLAGVPVTAMLALFQPLPGPERAAEIIVIREWRFIGGGANLTVTLHGIPMYGISTDEHVIIRVSPGDHVVGVMPRGLGMNEATLSVRAEARQRYYFRVETGSMFSPSPLLLPAATSVGEALIAKTREVK